jgi:dTDP-4-amino-4,6-dideoxygalactose transaminase
MLGSFGRCEVLSFHATKFFNTIEGGAVVTNDDDLADKMRLMRNFGFAGLDRVIYIGTNGKMTESSAALGLTNLESLQSFIETNRRNYYAYRDEIRSIPGLRLLEYDESQRSNYQYIVAEIGSDFGITRDQLTHLLHAENIRVRRYFWPGCHRMEPYNTLRPDLGSTLPQTEKVAARVLLFPTGTSIDQQCARQICGLLRFISSQADAIVTA